MSCPYLKGPGACFCLFNGMSMRLSDKILLTIVSTFAGLTLLLWFISNSVFLGSFERIEKDSAIRNVERALSALEAETGALAALNVDWASWDETYAFMNDRNPGYVKSTLNDETLAKQRLNFVVYLDSSGRVVYEKGLDIISGLAVPVPDGVRAHLKPGMNLLRHDTEDSGHEGVIVLKEGPALVVSRPVLTSEGKGPMRGSLVMGRFLGSDEVELLARTVHMDLSLSTDDPRQWPPPEAEMVHGGALGASPHEHDVSLQWLSDDWMEGVGLVRDIYGAPAFALKIRLPRAIVKQGRASISYFIAYMIAGALMAALMTMITIRTNIINRLVALGDGLGDVGRTGNLAKRVSISGNDELTALSSGVNRMLEDLESLEGGRRAAEERLRAAHDELEQRVHARTQDLVAANISLKDEIAERRRMEGLIKEMAYHDYLTGLPNRQLLMDRLEQAISRGNWRPTIIGVMFMDIDRFKTVNDTLGHTHGDELIRALAKRVLESLRDGDTVARIGGDEFTILLQDLGRAEDISLVAEKILAAVRLPVSIGGHDLHVTASAGIALHPADGFDAVALLRNADVAMYHAKSKGGDTFAMYVPAMSAKAMEMLTIGDRLRSAIANDEFVLYYQPQIDLKTGVVTGSEALIRWMDPEKGLIGPSSFIPLAEEAGLIVSIDDWTFARACAQTKKMQDAGFPEMEVSVNVSARAFSDKGFVNKVASVLEASGLPAGSLFLEITESLLMQNIIEGAGVMKRLRALGVRFSIDDFGTGYSSLGYLKGLPISQIKIDRSFVMDIPEDNDDMLIVSAIVSLAQSLRLEVVAEGVETSGQREYLEGLGCDKMQGFLFSKPLPYDDYMQMLRTFRAKTSSRPH